MQPPQPATWHRQTQGKNVCLPSPLPQCLCTSCSFCLECLSPRFLRSRLSPATQVPALPRADQFCSSALLIPLHHVTLFRFWWFITTWHFSCLFWKNFKRESILSSLDVTPACKIAPGPEKLPSIHLLNKWTNEQIIICFSFLCCFFFFLLHSLNACFV